MAAETRSRSASPTLLDLARAAGVSRTTASNAFNRPDQLSAELRERVLAIAREIGYSGPTQWAGCCAPAAPARSAWCSRIP